MEAKQSSYAVLLDQAAEFIRGLEDHPEILVVGQTRGAADDFVRTACGYGFVGVHRTTLTGLAVDLGQASLAREGLTPLGGLSMQALVARVIHSLRGGAIPYFEPVADTPGLAGAVAATFAELRLNDVQPAAVAATGRPGHDLARMLALFANEMAARSLADFALLLRLATAAAREGRHRLLGLPVVLLDVDLESKRLREFVDAVLARAPAVFDGRLATAPGSNGHSGRTLDRIRQSLFGEAVTADGEPDESLDYFSAAGESLECVEIARRIMKLASDDGVAFDRMAILLRSPERYQPLVEEALRRAAIPAYFSRGVARPDPAGRAFLALLACAAEGCSATRFAEYLSLGQAPPIDRTRDAATATPLTPDDEILARFYENADAPVREETEPEDSGDAEAAVIRGTLQTPWAWEKLLVDAAVIGGRERWSRRLRGLEAELRLQLADLDQKEEGRRQHLEREIGRLGNLERFALPLIDRLAALPRQATWGEWIDQLQDLAGAALRQPGSVLSLLDELQTMAEVGPVGLAEVTGVLRDRLRFLRREPAPRRYGQLFIGSIDEVRGRAFDIVFLPGLCEGLFPARAREDPILLDEYRDALAARLRVQNDRVVNERRRLHMACAAARTRLVFSYPRVDAVESRPRVPSFYALEIVRAAYGRLPDLRGFEEKARQSAPSRLDWPAPADPRDAIDDAEFDLATLGHATAPAAGHYLIGANLFLAQSLRRSARRERRAWFPVDGIVEPDDATRAVLATQRLAARSYSPSALQHFAACPYRFLLYGIHKLRPREECVALERLDPLTRGALFHEAQFQLFNELRSAHMLPIGPQNKTRVVEIADAVLEQVAAKNEEELAPAIPRVWRSEIEDLRTDLHGWIEQVAGDPGGWLPTHFEYSFGMAADRSRDSASVAADAVLDAGVRLRGAIDLIEIQPARGTLRITDHKTGKVPQPEPAYVGGGAFLQPLAYAFAAEKLLGEPVEMSRLFYCTERGGYREIQFELTPPKRAFFKQAMALIDGEIARGFLPAAPQRGVCAQCDYRPVCGPHEERRTAGKDQDALDALLELRRMP